MGLLQPSQFKQQLAEANERGRQQAATKKIYSLEHETLEPRTAEMWGHTDAWCRTCRPDHSFIPPHPSVLPPEA